MVERILLPADALRTWTYRALRRALGPWLGRWMREREQRVALLGALGIGTALALAVGAPLWLLALGPIVLGVPHVLSDLRYLWVQQGLHRQRLVWLLVVPLLVAGTVTAEVSWGLAAAALGLFAVPSTSSRRLAGLVLLGPLLTVSILWPNPTNLAFAHLHNLIAVGLWWLLWPRRERWHYVVLGLLVAASVALAIGAFDHLVVSAHATVAGPASGRPFGYYAYTLAPFAEPVLATRLVVLFAFTQSMHYLIWLRLIPEHARARRSPRPFVSTYRALRRELGSVVLGLAALGALGVAIWAAVDLAAARDGYLRAAIGHGHLELAAAALLFARGRAPLSGA
ncbi:MAG TPA: hypothetical protein ENK57_14935 [Polyangiaceae bacterium]|nr:hypothetical protein [Polyangiaceae bacterium]